MREQFGIQWHITNKCGNRCAHCYQEKFDGDDELPLTTLCEIADVIMRGVKDDVCVNITGGEPLLYRGGGSDDVFQFADYLSMYQNCAEINIITNAANLDGAMIDRIKSIPKLSQIKISLESNDARINDSIRGVGSFARTTKNIEMLARAGVSVMIMTTLSKRNYDCVFGICELALALGAHAVMFERYVPLGRGNNIKNDVLTYREWEKVLQSICAAANLDIKHERENLLQFKAFIIDMRGGALGDECELLGAPCCLGTSSMAIMPDGTIYPCRRTPVSVGKLPIDSMEKVFAALKNYSTQTQLCYDFDF